MANRVLTLVLVGMAAATISTTAQAECRSRSSSITKIISWGARKIHMDPELGSAATSMLSSALACALNSEQRKKATASTDQALNSSASDVPAAWKSDTDPAVTGSSTAAKPTKLADGSQCRVVTQVGYVEGKEIKETPQYCRAPGSSTWVMKA